MSSNLDTRALEEVFVSSYTVEAKIFFEHLVRVSEDTFFLIVGKHAGGGFAALPEWGVSCNIGLKPEDTEKNAGELNAMGLDLQIARALAKYIAEQIEENLLPFK